MVLYPKPLAISKDRANVMANPRETFMMKVETYQ